MMQQRKWGQLFELCHINCKFVTLNYMSARLMLYVEEGLLKIELVEAGMIDISYSQIHGDLQTSHVFGPMFPLTLRCSCVNIVQVC